MKNSNKCGVSIIIGIVLVTAGHYVSREGNTLRFSKQAMDIIGDAESCQRDPYHCPAGKLTQGIGHTGAGITASAATDKQIANWFAQDLLASQNCIEHDVEQRTERQLPQPVFDAMGSFVFNVGCSKFVHSSMYTFLLEGRYKLACDELSKWVYVGHQKLLGLIKRRAQEMSLCLSGLPG